MKRTPDRDLLATLIALVTIQLRTEIVDHLAGHPKAQHFDDDRTTTSATSDPTGTTATTPDQAATDLARHDNAIDQAYRCLLTLAALQNKYLPAHEPRRNTIHAETRGCQLHERAGVEEHQPARVTTDFASVLPTPLREPIPVCRACQDYTRRHQTLPTPEQVIRHHRTGKWTQRTTGRRATVFSAQQIADEWRTG